MEKMREGRKPIPRSLPRLATACADFSGFAKGENRSERIHEILIGLIQRYRQAIPRPFYAMREVAGFFDISLTTAYLIYQRLHREGAVTLMRSSQTMIAPRSHRPKFALRGVVCMPIWLPGFLYFLDWRRKFSELEVELSRHRFVLEPVFFRQGEDTSSAFVDRILKFNPDYVLWDGPVQTDRSTMQSIADAGVPLLTILGPTNTLPGRIYRRSFGKGLHHCFEAWKTSGEIGQIVVPQAGKHHRQDYVMPILESCSLPYQIKFYERGSSLSQYLKRLAANRRAGIFFADDRFFARMCAMLPEEMFQLFRRNRVVVMREVTMHCWSIPTDVTVDVLRFPNKRLARRIAMDLSQSKGALPSTEEIFEAEWRPRIPLKDIIQYDFDA